MIPLPVSNFQFNLLSCAYFDLLGQTTEIAKMVSESWKGLTPEDRKDWDEAADQDKKRYEQEKSTYKGPWKIPTNKRKTKE